MDVEVGSDVCSGGVSWGGSGGSIAYDGKEYTRINVIGYEK